PSAYSSSGSNANGRACPCQPTNVGSSRSARSGRTYSHPAPGPPHSHLTLPPVAKSTSSSVTSRGTTPADWYASSTTCAPASCARRTIGATSWISAVLNSTWLIGTSSVRSSIASTIALSSSTPTTSSSGCAW